MTADSRSRFPIEVVLVILATLVGIGVVLAAVGPELLSQIAGPTSAALPPTALPSSTRPYVPEIIPAPTETPDLARPLAKAQSPTPQPPVIVAPVFTWTSTLPSGPLPDLTVTGITTPVCLPERDGAIVEFNLYVWNIGRARTRSFGSFLVDVYLILGQRQYSLEEWAEQFDGVVGHSKMEFSNLEPGDDIKLTVVLDLKGNNRFGIQASANTGEYPIPDADTTNNTLIRYFTVYCY